ncbi:ANGE2 protein, partial [Polyodon spathula]|nr:ANGE2 protein [Polyodon spathula]
MWAGRKLDGYAIGFKQFKFSLVSSHPVEFFHHGIPLLDGDNVGLVLLLKPAATQSSDLSICVANTHLLYNPRQGDIKLTQLAILLAEIGQVSSV